MAADREVTIKGRGVYLVDAEYDTGDSSTGIPAGYCINEVLDAVTKEEVEMDAEFERELVAQLFLLDGDEEEDARMDQDD